MTSLQSPHLANIPQAVRIAASVDSSVDPGLKSQAIEYLSQVRELCDETWQDCLALYLQGAGAPGPSSAGRDGKQKLETDLRIFCEQVVDEVMIRKPSAMTPDAQQAMYNALTEFVQTEWVDGPCEGQQSFLRNKLAFTFAHLFLHVYTTIVPTFLHPLIKFLHPPDPSSSTSVNLHPTLLAVHVLSEIVQEIHDSTLRSARAHSVERNVRDGTIRDVIRSSGDERLAVEGMLGLAEKSLGNLAGGGEGSRRWLEVVELALNTLSAWTPWVDLSVSLTPSTLSFYHRLLHQSITSLRTISANVLRTFVAKGNREPAERLQVLKVLDIVTLLTPLEASSRSEEGEDTTAFRVALGSLLQSYGSELVAYAENVDQDISEPTRNEAELLMTASFPLLLRFLGDRQAEVSLSVANFISDLLRYWKRLYMPPKPLPVHLQNGIMPPPPTPLPPVPDDRRRFLTSLLDVSLRQLAWPDDLEWEAPGGEEPDPDDDLAMLGVKRITCRAYIESIAAIDKTLHTEGVSNIIVSTLEALQTRGPSGVSWQQAELAMQLIFSFGELTKNNTRAAFYDLPPEVANKSKVQRRNSASSTHGDTAMASGRTTPTSANGDAERSRPAREKIDYSAYPLSPLGQLLTLCISSGIISYPHASVTLQYFESAVRYVEFWKSRPGSIPPILEAVIDQRGIHQANELVRRRCFYLFARFVHLCRGDFDLEVIPPILDSIKDLLIIDVKLPQAETPEEDVLAKATNGKTYFNDQLHLFEAAGNLIYMTRSDATRQMPLLEAFAGPLMSGIGAGLQRYRASPQDLTAVLQVYLHLYALGHFAKGFPSISDSQLETLPYLPPFKQMTEALLEALDVMKTQRIVRDGARFAFSQFVNATGSSIAELVPRFVTHVVTEFEPSELVDFMIFLNLLMHRLKSNTFETIDMLLLPLLSRIFAVLQQPATGTDAVITQRRLKDTYLQFFTALMNANLDGVFISERNKPEFENLLSALLNLATDSSDLGSQRAAFSFFAKSVIAWGTSPEAAAAPSVFEDSALSSLSKAIANGQAHPTNQHAITKEKRATQALPGYENFIYQRLLPACFEVPMSEGFPTKGSPPVLFEIAMLLRNTLQARGLEAIDFLLSNLLPRLGCPAEAANQLVHSLRTQQSKDVRRTYTDFVRAMRS